MLGAVVSWVKRDPERFEGSTVGVNLEAWGTEELNDNAPSPRAGGSHPSEALRRVDQAVKVGDVIEIKILPPGPADAPAGEN